VAVPSSRYTPDHLQAHRWVCLDNPEWLHGRVNAPLSKPRFKMESVLDYVRSCNQSHVPVTFNVDIDRTGQFSPGSLSLLRDVKRRLPA